MHKKIDRTVVSETRYITLWVLIMSVLMQAVFLMLGRWNVSVLFGNILSAAAAVFNFFLMGLTVSSVLGLEAKSAETKIKLSMMGRTFLLFAVTAVGVLLPFFNTVSVIVPLFFPRIAVAMRPVFEKKTGALKGAEKDDNEGSDKN